MTGEAGEALTGELIQRSGLAETPEVANRPWRLWSLRGDDVEDGVRCLHRGSRKQRSSSRTNTARIACVVESPRRQQRLCDPAAWTALFDANRKSGKRSGFFFFPHSRTWRIVLATTMGDAMTRRALVKQLGIIYSICVNYRNPCLGRRESTFMTSQIPRLYPSPGQDRVPDLAHTGVSVVGPQSQTCPG